jgi:predicted MFS family arabinose efflux permease
MARALGLRVETSQAVDCQRLPGGGPATPQPGPKSLSSPSPAAPSQTRAIVFLAVAGFASQSMVRAADSLLPQIASDLHVTVGVASIIVSVYTFVHGSMQLFMGPVGDRFGKYRTCAIICSIAAVFVACCGLAPTLPTLVAARIGSAAFASWIIPLGMAYIGDVVPYERRQQVLARYLSGQISGQLFGQAAGGVLGDLIGWRGMFFVLAAILAAAAIGLFRELAVNPLTHATASAAPRSRGLIADFKILLARPWARIIIMAAIVEYSSMIGAFAYVGAYLRATFGFSYTVIGLVICMFAVGGLIYSLASPRLVGTLGQRGLASFGGMFCGAGYLLLAVAPSWWATPIAVTLLGLGFYMLHNTLQTNATQMAPDVRATAIGVFSAALYLGMTAGVAILAPVFDAVGGPPAFVGAGCALQALGLWVGRKNRLHAAGAARVPASCARGRRARSRHAPSARPYWAGCRRASS